MSGEGRDGRQVKKSVFMRAIGLDSRAASHELRVRDGTHGLGRWQKGRKVRRRVQVNYLARAGSRRGPQQGCSPKHKSVSTAQASSPRASHCCAASWPHAILTGRMQSVRFEASRGQSRGTARG
jgi:hypothetical protein